MLAPERFAAWMNDHQHVDRRFGHVYRYHSRSDAHSVALCAEILTDLLLACPVLMAQAERGEVVYNVNVTFEWLSTDKKKTLDLAIGPPALPVTPSGEEQVVRGIPSAILFSCEAKSVMTEHSKSKPRVYDELSSSHEIVHQGSPEAIATGITVVNIASSFVSPLRQTGRDSLFHSQHRQPAAAAGMIHHLRGLPIRERVGQVGFDAYATIVVECDNVGEVRLWTQPPAPQPGDRDHYQTFLERTSRLYQQRFATIAPP